MSAENISGVFKVDFSRYEKDMVARAMDRMLSQFKGSHVLREFIAAFIKNGPQYTYDQIVLFLMANTLYYAEGENLDAIGRIVGQPRVPYYYDDSDWFSTDIEGQGTDGALAWVTNASTAGNEPAADAQYRMMILARIASNFCKFASYPELQHIAQMVTGETVSWQQTGPMERAIIVRPGIQQSTLDVLTAFTTTTECDDIPMIPYAMTLNISSVIFADENAFMTDVEDGHQIDAGLAAVQFKL